MRKILTTGALALAALSLSATAQPASAAPSVGFSKNFVKAASRLQLTLQLTCPTGETWSFSGFAGSGPSGLLHYENTDEVNCSGHPQKVALNLDLADYSGDGFPDNGGLARICAYGYAGAGTATFSACSKRDVVLSIL